MFRSQRCDSTPHWQHPALTLDRSISILIVKSGPVIKPDTPQNTDPQKLFAKFFRHSKAEVRLAAGGEGKLISKLCLMVKRSFCCGRNWISACLNLSIPWNWSSFDLSLSLWQKSRKPWHSADWKFYARILFPFLPLGEFCLTYSSICRRDQWVKPLQMINRLVPTTILLYCACSPSCFVHINQILLTRPLAHNCFWSGLEHMTLT